MFMMIGKDSFIKKITFIGKKKGFKKRFSSIIFYGKNLLIGQKYLTFFFFDLFRQIIDGNTKKTYQMD